jgi:type I restriction enzyme S subunit
MTWPFVEFSVTTRKTEIGRENQILAAEIKPSGKIPVVDQGQAFISGYCDEVERTIRQDLPVIVFGDHTRCVKYVDFPFVLGADGTKVLKPREDLFDAKFFYYALLSFNIPNRGYNRHFTLLKQRTVPTPEKDEQRRIATVLDLVERAVKQQERLIALTAELKKTLVHNLFTGGVRDESRTQAHPESWERVALSEVCTFLSGGTPSKQNPDFWQGEIPWVSPKDMKRPRLTEAVDRISEAGLQDGSVLAPAGSVLVVVRGMILAKDVPVALAGIPMAFNQDMKAIVPGPKLASSYLLYALGAFKQKLFEKVGRSAHGTMTLMSSEIANFVIPLPDKATQEKIADAIETVERKHQQHQRRHAILTDLFRTVLHQLMTAQIRVHNLDLSEMEAAAAE